jgi:hypothetical protein
LTEQLKDRSIVIAGEVSVKGNVQGKGKIDIKKDCSVNGDLTTAQIIIEDGAYFKGSIEIVKSAEKEGDKNGFRGRHLHRLRQRWARSRGVSSHEGMLRIGTTSGSLNSAASTQFLWRAAR